MQTIDLKRIPDHHARVGRVILPHQPDITEPTDTVTVRVDQIAGIFPGHGLARWEPKEQRFWSGLLPEGKTVSIIGWERGTWCDVAMLDGTRIYVRESFDSLRARWVAALSGTTTPPPAAKSPPLLHQFCKTPNPGDYTPGEGWLCPTCGKRFELTKDFLWRLTPPPAATPLPPTPASPDPAPPPAHPTSDTPAP